MQRNSEEMLITEEDFDVAEICSTMQIYVWKNPEPLSLILKLSECELELQPRDIDKFCELLQGLKAKYLVEE